jgi:SAM-dependent methyltransferase
VARVYDPLDPDRRDLAVYVAIAHELGARGVVDIGCGTGMFAGLLADAGIEVIGVDPAAAMLDVARHQPGAERVRWIHGTATDLPPLQVDMVTMTGNVAQVFLDDGEWAATLAAAHRALRPDGFLVFETRRPQRKAWQDWNPPESYQSVEIAGVGRVDTWDEVTVVDLPLVSFQSTIRFHAEGSTITSSSTLRFRDLEEIAASLDVAGFVVREVREAPDRPGQEYVFLAQTE